MSLHVRWQKDLFTLPCTINDTLGALRSTIADHTGLDRHAFKLIHAGAVMKDDNATLATYRITQKSTVVVVGSNAPHILSPHQTNALDTIRSHLGRVRTSLVPRLDALLNVLLRDTSPDPANEHHQRHLSRRSDPTSDTLPPLTAPKEIEAEHARLSELLLQALLTLDTVPISSPDTADWEHVRKERKTAVREVQGLLDDLDWAWRLWKG